MKITVSTVLLSLAISFSALAQTPPPPNPRMASADEFLKASKWAEAAAAYEAIVKGEPTNARAWRQLATARYSAKQYGPAAEAYQKTVALTDDPNDMFNLACMFSLKGDKDAAINTLTKAVHHPKAIVQIMNLSDPDLQSLKGDPRFEGLNDEVQRIKAPCMFSAEARQFDFWIGQWDVFNPQGRKDGTSVVQRFANGCGLLENWQGAFGGDGKSINFYDPEAKKWFQYWVGGNNAPVRYSGVYKDGAIRYEGEVSSNAKNPSNLIRLTFFNLDANTVRQFAENSSDGGKTWTVGYDYKYVRKAPAPQ